MAPAGVTELPLPVGNPVIAHSTPMPLWGWTREALLQLMLKNSEMEERRLQHDREERQLQHDRRERGLQHEREQAETATMYVGGGVKQRQFELERTRLELDSMACTPSHSMARESSGKSKLARILRLVPAIEKSKVTKWFERFEKKAYEFSC